jgi:hypothetical protein
MRVRLALTAFALSAVAAACYFAQASRAEEASQRPKRSTTDTAVTEDLLATIRIGLREAQLGLLARERKLERVTAAPFNVPSPGCRGPLTAHDGFWIHVYVTPSGRDMMTTGKRVYPPGTLILKQKFLDALGKKTELFTGMLKREKGYAPQVGDWEFFVLNAQATRVTSVKNELISCTSCHESFRDTDFVSRSYLTEKQPPEWPLIRDLRP